MILVTSEQLVVYLAHYLQADKVKDYAPNGLQVQGRERVERICTAVTASYAVIKQAQVLQADALLVHHGFFWQGESAPLIGTKYQRIKALIQQDINLLAYHLPLDCHAEVGNNACLGRLLGAEQVQPHPASGISDLLWSGRLAQTMSYQVFGDFLTHIFQRAPLCIVADGQHTIQQIAWCTGAAQDLITDAKQLGVDAYISGEISERTYYQAKELGIHYFACGHHATERYGIQALGEHLAKQFDLVHMFIDTGNPI